LSSIRTLPQYFQTRDVMAPGVRSRPLPSTFSPTEQSLITHHTELLTVSLNNMPLLVHISSASPFSPHFDPVQSTVRAISSRVRVSPFCQTPLSQSIQSTLPASPFSLQFQPVHSVHTISQSILSTLSASPFSPRFQSVHSVHTPSQSMQSTIPASPFCPHYQPVHSVHTPSQSMQSTILASPLGPHPGSTCH
jgi:hypothetical protein